MGVINMIPLLLLLLIFNLKLTINYNYAIKNLISKNILSYFLRIKIV